MTGSARGLMAVMALALALSACTAAPPLPTPRVEAPRLPSPTASSSSASADPYAVGAAFDEDCTIAWPLEPVVLETRIQLTLDCPSVPSSDYFLVIAVHYDPDLPISRDVTDVHVTGEVIDTTVAESGFMYLIVEASAVDF